MTRDIAPSAVRKTILELAYRTGIGHLPTCFSVVELLTALYSTVLRHDPQKPQWTDRDYFILSKGHAAGAIYSVLAHAGYFAPEFLVDTYGARNSWFGCHPDRNKVPGIEASTGSLGHGMPFALGIALGLRMHKKPNRVFCLIGDGEANEGSIWEASLVAAHQGLENFTGILDWNHSQARCLPLTDPGAKWLAFGWNVIEADGHSVADLQRVYNEAIALHNGKPTMIVAHTVKGKGVSLLEQDFYTWHHKAPSAEDYARMLEELR